MSYNYYKGIFNGVNDLLYDSTNSIKNLMINSGFEMYDLLDTTAGRQKFVLHSDGTGESEIFIRFENVSNNSIKVKPYQNWSTVDHTGNSGITTDSVWTCSDSTVYYWLCANEYALSMMNNIVTPHYTYFVGEAAYPNISPQMSGKTRLTQDATAGQTRIYVDSINNFMISQKIQIAAMDRVNRTKLEVVIISNIGSNYFDLSTGLVNSYDIGGLVGSNVQNVCVNYSGSISSSTIQMTNNIISGTAYEDLGIIVQTLRYYYQNDTTNNIRSTIFLTPIALIENEAGSEREGIRGFIPHWLMSQSNCPADNGEYYKDGNLYYYVSKKSVPCDLCIGPYED